MTSKWNRWTKFLAAILIAGSLTSPVWAQSAPAAAEPQWANADESNMGLAAQDEKDPAKQLDLLTKWEQQYPNSAFKNLRTLRTANALLNIIAAAFTKADAPSVDAGQKAARQLIEHFNVYFDTAVKPASLSDQQWAGVKNTAALQAHALLARIAAAKKDDATAEAEYKKILAIDPTQAATSYQLGSAILRQMAKSQDVNPARYSEAIYDLARSLSVTGPNALPAEGTAAAEKALKANYANYHGSMDGMDDLMKQAAKSALPPADFHILSAVEIDAAKQRDHDLWAKEHPELDFWETIKTALETQGDAYFLPNLKDVALPPPASDAYKGAAMFKGTVVSVPSPKQILVNVDNATGDALLKLDENIKGDVPAGTAIQFKGVVDSWTKEPSYVLTFTIQEPKTDIAGLPDGVSFVPDTAVRAKTGAKGKTASNPAK